MHFINSQQIYFMSHKMVHTQKKNVTKNGPHKFI